MIKLGIQIKENGTLTVVDIKTGEEIAGQRHLSVESAMEMNTIGVLEFLVFDLDGKEAMG